MTGPSFEEVVAFVRDFTGVGDHREIDAETCLQADLGVTGDDGSGLLEQAEHHFGVALSSPEHGYRQTFGLGRNEYLFHSEGLDLLGITRLIRWLKNEPRPAILDLTVGALHDALVQCRARQEPPRAGVY